MISSAGNGGLFWRSTHEHEKCDELYHILLQASIFHLRQYVRCKTFFLLIMWLSVCLSAHANKVEVLMWAFTMIINYALHYVSN